MYCTLLKSSWLTTAVIFAVVQSTGTLQPAEQKSAQRLIGPLSVPPEGWRLTVNGWEQADLWASTSGAQSAQRINRLIELQSRQESATPLGSIVTKILGMLRRVDPITLASGQISIIAMLLFVARYSRERRMRHDNSRPFIAPTGD
jgi:hypothetical protein